MTAGLNYSLNIYTMRPQPDTLRVDWFFRCQDISKDEIKLLTLKGQHRELSVSPEWNLLEKGSQVPVRHQACWERAVIMTRGK